MARAILLTGQSNIGKTTLVKELVMQARQAGYRCAGLLSPARFADGARVGIDVMDVATGQIRPLATRGQACQPGGLGHIFDPEALAWGASVLARAIPCDLLVVDELGPLELRQGEGWHNGLDVLNTGGYRLAVTVVRPALLPLARRTLTVEHVVCEVTPSRCSEIVQVLLSWLRGAS